MGKAASKEGAAAVLVVKGMEITQRQPMARYVGL
jgi:hypothetical protein